MDEGLRTEAEASPHSKLKPLLRFFFGLRLTGNSETLSICNDAEMCSIMGGLNATRAQASLSYHGGSGKRSSIFALKEGRTRADVATLSGPPLISDDSGDAMAWVGTGCGQRCWGAGWRALRGRQRARRGMGTP